MGGNKTQDGQTGEKDMVLLHRGDESNPHVAG